MTYNHSVFNKLISAEVPRKIALALADDSAPFTQVTVDGASTRTLDIDSTPSVANHASTHAIGGTDVLAYPGRLLAQSAPGSVIPGIVNTVTETSLFDVTVSASSVAAGDFLKYEASWDTLNNSGASATYTYKVKLGATTVFTSAGFTLGTSASRAKWRLEMNVALYAIADQRWGASLLGTGASGSTLALLNASNAAVGTAQSTENLTSDKVLSVTVTMGTAAATIDTRPFAASLIRVR